MKSGRQAEKTTPRGPSLLFLPHLDVLAHTGRSLLVARELRTRGCEVTFAGAGKYEKLLREEGFPVRGLPEISAAGLVSESRRGRRWPFHEPGRIRSFVEAELALLEELQPDAVVFDHRYTAGLSAEIAGLPRISITNIWWTPYDAAGWGLPRTHPLFASLPWLSFLARLPGADRIGNALTQMMFSRWARPYNAVRREYGLPPLGSILDFFRGDLVLLPDTAELAPARRLPEDYRYVGPLVWEPEGELPGRVRELEEFVYVSMGSSADPRIFDTITNALELAGDPPAVITTGGVRDPSELEDRARGRVAFDFLPGSKAAARASLVLCQGGIGTVYQALAAGTPVLAVPFMPEQEVYGARAVEKRGAGLSLAPRGLTAGELAAKIEQIRDDPSFRRAAEGLAARIDLESGPRLAAEGVLGMLRRP